MNLKSIVFAEMPINFNESTYQAAFFGCNKFIETQILTKTQLNRFKHLLTQPGRQTFLKVFGGLHVHLVKCNFGVSKMQFWRFSKMESCILQCIYNFISWLPFWRFF